MSLQNSFNKIRRNAGIKKCVMIDGNVGDVYLDDKNKIVTLREFLEAMFKDMDYQDIVYWDRVEGATGAIDKLTLTDEVEVEGDAYDLGDEEEESFINALRQAWDINRERPVEIEKLPINQDGRHILIPYTQIVYIEAYEDYSFVHTAQDRFLSSHRLKNLEIRLRPHRFCRVHRKYLVNLDMVTEIATMPGGNFMLRTAGRKKIELPVSRRRIGELKKILQL